MGFRVSNTPLLRILFFTLYFPLNHYPWRYTSTICSISTENLLLEISVLCAYISLARPVEEEEPMFMEDIPMTSPQVQAPRKRNIFLTESLVTYLPENLIVCFGISTPPSKTPLPLLIFLGGMHAMNLLKGATNNFLFIL